MTLPPKTVAILQSSYIPWKGYFDLINSVDEFILYDDVQFTKRDWRSRNQIKTSNGPLWLSVPVKVKGRYHQKIKDAEIDGVEWRQKHWKSIEMSYKKAPFFQEYSDLFRELYNEEQMNLSELNYGFIKLICDLLNIKTKITFSNAYDFLESEPTDQLVDLCIKSGATKYISGPAAKDYMEIEKFNQRNISVEFYDYSGYPEYSQLYPPFVHSVSIIDMIFNLGPETSRFMQSF